MCVYFYKYVRNQCLGEFLNITMLFKIQKSKKAQSEWYFFQLNQQTL